MNDFQSQFDDVLNQWRAGVINDAAAAIQLMLFAGLDENPEDAIRQLMDSVPPRIIAAIEQIGEEKLEVKTVEEIGIFRLNRR
jgi:hypothetical protein